MLFTVSLIAAAIVLMVVMCEVDVDVADECKQEKYVLRLYRAPRYCFTIPAISI